MLVIYPLKKTFSRGGFSQGALNHVISLLKRDFPLGAGRSLFYIKPAAHDI